jgi:hypothetical protein
MNLLLFSTALVAASLASTFAADPELRVSDITLFGDMECFKIETPSATYLYGKRGAGFAGIIDPAGHDWISYHHGGKALGEYRGLPKCGQPVKYFHCGYGFGQYANENPFSSTITLREPAHVRLHSETKNGDAACDWDFFPAYATMTLTKIPGPHWFLYEGTPGGALDPADDFVLRPGGRKTPLSEPWTDSVPWVCFGARESPHGLLLLHHQAPEPGQTDSYVSWPYKSEADGALNQMTVFGFGRPAWTDPKQHTPPLQVLPAKLSIAITGSTEPAPLDAIVKKIQGL